MVAKLYSYAFETSYPKWPIRKGLILEWNDGWGEIAPLPGFSQETLEDARKEIESLLSNLGSAKPTLPSVQFGVASALRPFSREPLKIPLSSLNNPRPGFSFLKLKVGHLSVPDAVLYVRQFLGRYRLRIDCNRAWNLEQALAFTRHFSPSDFEYLEEPVFPLSDLIRFSEETGFPIALDESIALHSKIPTLKTIVVKPTVTGSVPAYKAPVVLSSAFESSLGLLQIARLYQNGSPAAGLDTFQYFKDDLLNPPLRAENGFLIWEGSCGCPIDRTKLCAL